MGQLTVSKGFYFKAYNILVNTLYITTVNTSVCFNRLKNKFPTILITQTVD